MNKEKLEKANKLNRKISRYEGYYSFVKNAVIDVKKFSCGWALEKEGRGAGKEPWHEVGTFLNIDGEDHDLIVKIFELLEEETKIKLKELKKEFDEL